MLAIIMHGDFREPLTSISTHHLVAKYIRTAATGLSCPAVPMIIPSDRAVVHLHSCGLEPTNGFNGPTHGSDDPYGHPDKKVCE